MTHADPPTERSVRISRTTLFGRWFTALWLLFARIRLPKPLAFRARRLRELLGEYAAKSRKVEECQEQLEPILRKAERGGLKRLAGVPCSRNFVEGDFADFPDLEDAYADFYVAVTGIE